MSSPPGAGFVMWCASDPVAQPASSASALAPRARAAGPARGPESPRPRRGCARAPGGTAGTPGGRRRASALNPASVKPAEAVAARRRRPRRSRPRAATRPRRRARSRRSSTRSKAADASERAEVLQPLGGRAQAGARASRPATPGFRVRMEAGEQRLGLEHPARRPADHEANACTGGVEPRHPHRLGCRRDRHRARARPGRPAGDVREEGAGDLRDHTRALRRSVEERDGRERTVPANQPRPRRFDVRAERGHEAQTRDPEACAHAPRTLVT